MGLRWLGPLALVALLGCCDGGGGDGGDDGTPQGSVDAGGDDGGPDGTDGTDAGFDAGQPDDAGPDAALDTGPSGDVGPGPDAGPPPPPPLPPIFHRFLGGTFFARTLDHLVPEGSTWELVDRPPNATAEFLAEPELRLTPDVPGGWILALKDAEGNEFHRLILRVRDERPDSGTWQHFGYGSQKMLGIRNGLIWAVHPFRYELISVNSANGQPGATIPTGAWPVSMALRGDTAVVALQAEDCLAIVDFRERRVIDGIHVGDEPTNVLLDSCGSRAFVTLMVTGEVVAVDLASRSVVARQTVTRDPRAMTLSADGSRLYVASFRSGNSTRRAEDGPEGRSPEEDLDIFVLDTTDLSIVRSVPRVGTVLRGLLLSADGLRLMVAGSESDNLAEDVGLGDAPHRHRISTVVVDEAAQGFGTVTHREVGVLAEGFEDNASSPYALARGPGGTVWMTAAGSDRVWRFDGATLDPLGSTEVGGFPRDILVTGDFVWISNFTSGDLSLLNAEGTELLRVPLGADPRPAGVAEGHRLFHSAKVSGNGTFSCSSCHPDNNTDTLVWNLNMTETSTTRAIRLLSGTLPLLWDGINPNALAFAFEVTDLMGGSVTSDEARALGEYISFLSLPPRANAWTERNGDHTPAGLRGMALFGASPPEGAGCADCHAGPKLTNQRLTPGKNDGLRTDVPTLLGAYRNGIFFRKSNYDTMDEAARAAVEFTGGNLSEEQMADLTRYLLELTPKAPFVVLSKPVDGSRGVPAATSPEVAFSAPVDPDTLDAVVLWDATADVEVPSERTSNGAFVRLVPESPFAEGHRIEVRVAASLHDEDGNPTGVEAVIGFDVGAAPVGEVTGRYALDLEVQVAGTGGERDGDILRQHMEAQLVTIDGYVLGTVFVGAHDFHVEGVLDGANLAFDPFSVTFDDDGEPLLGNLQEIMIQVEDEDGDGMIEGGTGTVLAGILAFTSPGELTVSLIE